MEETLKVKRKTLAKPNYNLFQNSGFMIRIAWQKQKGVLWFVLALAAFDVIINVLGLFAAPTILGAIETGVPIGRLVTLILLFTAGLMAMHAAAGYVNCNTLFGRMEVRQKVISMILEKTMSMSLPNRECQEVQRKLEKSYMVVNNNDKATEAIWVTLTDLLKNIAGFVIYIVLLAKLNPLVTGLVLATTVTGFFVSNYLNGWGFRHRDEEAEYSRRMNYLNEKSRDHTLAKDIHIFGMKN